MIVQRETLLAAGFRIGRKAGLRAASAALEQLVGHLAERDRDLAALRCEFDRDIGELRNLLAQLSAMNEPPPTGFLH